MRKKRPVIQLTVVRKQQISPNMQRITLTGPEVAQLPTDCAGHYLKLLFNPHGGTNISQLSEDQRPVFRTYTVRSIEPEKQQISIDFMRHEVTIPSIEKGGFAAHWAINCKLGESISIGGPNSMQDVNMNADSVIIVADMTALPAAIAKIEALDKSATGDAFLLILQAQDKQTIDTPLGLNIHWVIENQSEQLVNKVQQKPWPNGSVSVWCACEFSDMRAIREYIGQQQVPRTHCYFSSYWKKGCTEDGHKVLKKQDSEDFNK